ncbi:unnamed protein product [Symbiodinium microadriaticum]|nr:unnamed protein product [Symbiodinium microadriaticum]
MHPFQGSVGFASLFLCLHASECPVGQLCERSEDVGQDGPSLLQQDGRRGRAEELVALPLANPCVLHDTDIECPYRFKDQPLRWVKLTYPKRPFTSIDEVSWEDAEGSPALGKLNTMKLGVHNFALAAKLHPSFRREGKIYGLVTTYKAGHPKHLTGGCCADYLRVWHSSYGDAKYEDINILAAAERALSKKPLVFVAPTHTFFLEEFDGVLHAIICVQYKEKQTDNNFGGVFLDAFIVLNLEDGRTLKKTADGEDYFSIYDSLGTFSSESSETIYKIPFKNVSNKTRNPDNPAFTQQWHLNGVTRFIAGDTAVLAFTTYFLNAAVLLKDPFTHKSADGGGEILQQFGMPGYGESSRTVPGEAAPMTPPHKFGMAADVPGWDGVHNVYPYQKEDGSWWMTLFNNNGNWTKGASQEASSANGLSIAWDFRVRLVPKSGAAMTDDVFATDYTRLALERGPNDEKNFSLVEGGGVFITGAAQIGLVVHDASGRFKSWNASQNIYDSFAAFTAP